MLRRFLASLTLSLLTIACYAADVRTVAVEGHASVTAAPNIARLNMAVEARNLSLSYVQKRLADVAEDFLKLCGKLGIEARHVRTSGATIRPEYRWDQETESRRLINYVGARQFEVELRELDKLGQLIEGAVEAGVNQMSPPALDTSLRRELYRDALALAANDARENATVLVETLGASLGPIVEMNAVESRPPPVPRMRLEAAAMAADAGPEATYNTGDIEFEARVTAVFEIVESVAGP